MTLDVPSEQQGIRIHPGDAEDVLWEWNRGLEFRQKNKNLHVLLCHNFKETWQGLLVVFLFEVKQIFMIHNR